MGSGQHRESDFCYGRRMKSDDDVALRPPVAADVAKLFQVFSDHDVMRFIGEGLLQGRTYYERFVEREASRARERGYCLQTIVVAGEVAGFAGIHDWDAPWGPTGELEMGWRLGRKFWGRGIAYAAGRLVLDRSQGVNLVAMIQAGNIRSEALATRLGFGAVEVYEDPNGRTVHCYRNHPV